MLDVQWVPSDPTQFITWGGDIRHYSVLDNDQVLLSTLTEPLTKCVAVWGGPGVVLAAGQATGRVSFVSFQEGEGRHLLSRELPARVTRQVTALAWAPGGSSVLATGLEKHRTDNSVVVWDLAQGRTADSPLLETCSSETCSSMDWFRAANRLAVGMGGKSVRLLDPRASKPGVSSTNSRATEGVTVDPSSDFRLAAHVDNQIQIWDIRNFDKPVVSLEQERAVTRISWCPTRPGLLASTARDCGTVLLHDIMSWPPGQEDGEPSVTDRTVEPPQPVGNMAGFAWHPDLENTLLVAGNSGRFAVWQVSDRLTLNWSVRHCLVWAGGKNRMKNITLDTESDTDIAVVMQERAKRGYGAAVNMKEVGTSVSEEELRLSWVWCQHSSDLLQSGKLRSHVRSGQVKVPGVRTVLRSGQSVCSQVRSSQWTGVSTVRPVRTFWSEQREAVLGLCRGLGDIVHTDTRSRTADRAAAAIFSLDLKRALAELQTGASAARNSGQSELANALTMVCMALSGFSDCDSWRETVSCSLSSLPHPAIRAIFSFLTVRDANYTSVLEEDGLLLVQRIAFAATFLDDESLETYLDSEWVELLKAGRLEALVLTGSEAEVVEVLQSYLDRTADLQTVSWMSVKILSVEAVNSEQVTAWVESYRTLLDQWRMFNTRTELDLAITTAGSSSIDSSQVFVCCYFCGKSISPWYKGLPRGGQTGSLTRQGVGGNKPKIQSCPYCKKPLPRCAVCLVNMGTASGTSGTNIEHVTNTVRDMKLNNFSSWFSWCQTCRHGGHAGHLTQWFSEHSDCPVTGCSCKCAQLDCG